MLKYLYKPSSAEKSWWSECQLVCDFQLFVEVSNDPKEMVELLSKVYQLISPADDICDFVEKGILVPRVLRSFRQSHVSISCTSSKKSNFC